MSSIIFIGKNKAIHLNPNVIHIYRGDKGYREGSVCLEGVSHDGMLFSLEIIEKYKKQDNVYVFGEKI